MYIQRYTYYAYIMYEPVMLQLTEVTASRTLVLTSQTDLIKRGLNPQIHLLSSPLPYS